MTVGELIRALRALDVPDDTPVVTADYLDVTLAGEHTLAGERLIILTDTEQS